MEKDLRYPKFRLECKTKNAVVQPTKRGLRTLGVLYMSLKMLQLQRTRKGNQKILTGN